MAARHQAAIAHAGVAQRRQAMRRQLAATCIVAALVLCGVFYWLSSSGAKKTKTAAPAAESTAIVETETSIVPEVSPAPVPPSGPVASNDTPKTEAVPAKPDAAGEPKLEEKNLFDKEADLALTGMEATRDTAKQRDEELFNRAIDGESWSSYRQLLSRSIQGALANIKPGTGLNQYDSLWSEPALYQALLRWKALGVFSEAQITEHVQDKTSAGFLRWLLHNNAAMEELAEIVGPRDDGGNVLKFMMEAWSLTDGIFDRYYSLALAHAVVFDEPMRIPYAIGNDKFPAETEVDPIKRYRWYVEKDEKGQLARRVRDVPTRELIWVVCAPITTAEMEWAIDKLHGSPKNWGENYGKVTYLMERAVNGVNPYKEYSFAEILKEGGICGDQAYFCVNTARAQGIPAMVLTGETDLGGHAWAGMETNDREWTTSIGRIGGVSKGQAGNPQTGDPITEQEIHLWNDRAHQSPNARLNILRHLWLADYLFSAEETEKRSGAIKLANRIGPSFTETWQALYTLLKEETSLAGEPEIPTNLAEWQAFAKNMRNEFKDNPRMADLAREAESEYIFPYIGQGDARRSLLRERRRIERDSGEQKDLIASSLKREADFLHKKSGNAALKEISQMYDRALRDFGGSVTGFKMMAEDYFAFCKSDPELARKAARDIELAFKRVVETGTKDWFRAKTESGIYLQIGEYYRTAGDEKRADMINSRMETLMKRSKRGAL